MYFNAIQAEPRRPSLPLQVDAAHQRRRQCGADGIDKIVVGSSVTLVNLYNSGGSALLEFDDGSAHYTYALLNGVSPSAIDGSDLLFA
ncbi:hypothetical protein [Rhizobium sp. WYJ-E13]|uniref:hypothetical protein n=1 Tax=Rhizobium sp. WYJ-E13 TaxID=2849093 RepID=UPI001C1EA7D4|nr:hypothetical protein [Rhizobium sp. WYJ-E13]QWW68254.1 hypothetical protein KQ933_00665 [Rhizobium sp. WYJ-E13]